MGVCVLYACVHACICMASVSRPCCAQNGRGKDNARSKHALVFARKISTATSRRVVYLEEKYSTKLLTKSEAAMV